MNQEAVVGVFRNAVQFADIRQGSDWLLDHHSEGDLFVYPAQPTRTGVKRNNSQIITLYPCTSVSEVYAQKELCSSDFMFNLRYVLSGPG
jgi:hypothetical protein